MGSNDLEKIACSPIQVQRTGFNSDACLPHGLSNDHLYDSMSDFIKFLGVVNKQLHVEKLGRMESFSMPANFSSTVGEFLITRIAEHCPGLVKNTYHNGHPDLVPVDVYEDNSVLHGDQGIEVKASRYEKSWQGHNAETTWLMVFVFDVNSPNDPNPVRPFRFRRVLGGQLEQTDWSEAGRTGTSRRTPTASVLKPGSDKMEANWIYWVD